MTLFKITVITDFVFAGVEFFAIFVDLLGEEDVEDGDLEGND